MAPDPYRYFRVEAPELLDQLGKTVLDLEKEPSPDLVARFLRLAHTLKGAARVVKQREIADQAHAIEELLLPFRDANSLVPRKCIDNVLKLLDDAATCVKTMTPPADTAAAPRPHPEEPLLTVRADAAEMDALLEAITETRGQLGSLRKSAATLQHARQLAELLLNQLAAPRGRENAYAGNAKALPVAEDLCALLNGYERGQALGMERIDRELRQARDAAEQLRLVPARTLFTSLERTARDAAQVLGKRVAFEGRGGDIRLDAHVLGVVQGALTQLIRNAVAHGIEPENERKARGKPPTGQVTLDVARRGRHVVFSCVDNGAGVDIEAVRRVAQEKGLLTTEVRKLSPEDLLRMLLRGGISTSRTVTAVSGRGVGLDVVREVTERLGGTVDVRSVPGKGTTVEVISPLSLASLEALTVDAAGITATIPLDAVLQALRLSANEVVRTPEGESVVYQGKVIPFVPLARLIAVKDKPVQYQPAHLTGASSAVVVRGIGGVAAIGVDRLLDTECIVLRPLPQLAFAAAVIAGASLDPEGNPQVVLDPDALVAEAARSRSIAPEPEQTRPPILVIDDSLTTRMLEQSILESAGFEVDVAVSAEEGLMEARRKRYGLFLTDIEMPGMDGFAFIERIRADPTLRDIPAILVSSRASHEDRQRGESVGAQGYIVKSEFDQGEFLERIRQLVC